MADHPWRVSTSAAVSSVIPAPSVVIPGRSSRTFAAVRDSVSIAAAVGESRSGGRLDPKATAPADGRRQSRTGQRADRDSCADSCPPNGCRACACLTGGERAADRAEARRRGCHRPPRLAALELRRVSPCSVRARQRRWLRPAARRCIAGRAGDRAHRPARRRSAERPRVQGSFRSAPTPRLPRRREMCARCRRRRPRTR